MLLAAIAASSVALADQRVRLEWNVNGESGYRDFVVSNEVSLIALHGMKDESYPATTGKCEGVDTSKLNNTSSSGVEASIKSRQYEPDAVWIDVDFAYLKFLGTTPFKYKDDCIVNDKQNSGFNFSSSGILKKQDGVLSISKQITTNYPKDGAPLVTNQVDVRLRWLNNE